MRRPEVRARASDRCAWGALAHGLGASVVAEGIETPAELELLVQLGADHAQGYHFSPPVDRESFIRMLEPGYFRDQLPAEEPIPLVRQREPEA